MPLFVIVAFLLLNEPSSCGWFQTPWHSSDVNVMFHSHIMLFDFPQIMDLAGLAAPLILGRRIPNWVPRVDGYLVSEEPRRALQKGWSKDIDIMTGYARHDAAFIIYLNPLGMGYGRWINIAKVNNAGVHDDVIKWKHFPRYWPFVRGIHRSRRIPRTKASDVELWCFLWSAPE